MCFWHKHESQCYSNTTHILKWLVFNGKTACMLHSLFPVVVLGIFFSFTHLRNIIVVQMHSFMVALFCILFAIWLGIIIDILHTLHMHAFIVNRILNKHCHTFIHDFVHHSEFIFLTSSIFVILWYTSLLFTPRDFMIKRKYSMYWRKSQHDVRESRKMLLYLPYLCHISISSNEIYTIYFKNIK